MVSNGCNEYLCLHESLLGYVGDQSAVSFVCDTSLFACVGESPCLTVLRLFLVDYVGDESLSVCGKEQSRSESLSTCAK